MTSPATRSYALPAILIIALVCRLYHITFPVGGFHGWRQADTAMIAKNFYEQGYKFCYPQIDWAGDRPGYIETEFPLYPFIVALLYGVFGAADAWGRVASVIFALITIYALYHLVRKYLGASTAAWAGLVYAVLPLNIYYSRTFMPESMMLMSSVCGVRFFSQWVDGRRKSDWIAAAVSIALAALLKITALHIGLVLLFLAWKKSGRRMFVDKWLWGFGLAVLTPVVVWYAHAHQVYLESGLSFGIWDYGSGKWGNFGPLLTVKFYNDILFKSIAERHLTYAGFILFVGGLSIRRESVEEKLFDWWLIAVCVYFGLVAVGNQIHEYYQLPFVIPASVFIGKTLNKFVVPDAARTRFMTGGVRRSLVFLCLAALPILSLLRYTHFMRGEQIEGALYRLGDAVQAHTASADLIVTVDEGDPVFLYRCGRRGWHSSPESLQDSILLEMNLRGASYIAGTKEMFNTDDRQRILRRTLRRYPGVVDDPEYFITQLPPASGDSVPLR